MTSGILPIIDQNARIRVVTVTEDPQTPHTPVNKLAICLADLRDPDDVTDYREQLSRYALDPMGGGNPLADRVLGRVCEDLAEMSHAHVFLARLDGRCVGFATCFQGYSTFRGRPLWNIHDLAVSLEVRARGIGRALLRHIATQAQAAGCCKLTLEVREDNPRAAALYRKAGFGPAELEQREVQYLFLEKRL